MATLLLVTAALQAQEQPRIRVEASVLSFPTGDWDSWRAVVNQSGVLQGEVGEAAFSSTTIPAQALARIQALARCVVAVPEPRFQGCPMIEPPPPMSLLRVRVGGSSRDVELCEPILEPGTNVRRKVAARVALELLIAVRDLVPRRAYDYRIEYRPAAQALPDPSNHCPWVTEVR